MGRAALIALALSAGCATSGGEPLECAADTADCNGEFDDGCETDLTSADSCGGCDVVCDGAPAGATDVCENKLCAFTCDAPMVRCGPECLARCATIFETPGQSTYTPPAGCTRIAIKAWGAGGGHGSANTGAAAGGYAEGELDIAGGTIIVVVGAPGASAPGQGPGAGGAPGGGSGGSSNSQGGGGGGGFSGVFLDDVAAGGAIVIAGGGGGSGGGTGGSTVAGAGGGIDGQDGTGLGVAGTADTGFAPLLGGDGGSQGSGDGGGGGGGGWFGGNGGAGANSDAQSGGGGSGYSATAGAVLVAGDRAVPGNATDADRGTAAEPLAAGKVVVDCIESSAAQ